MTLKKRYILIIPSLLLIWLVGWVIFELTIEDVKGEENVVKNTAFMAAQMIPAIIPQAKPAIRLSVPYHHQEHKLSCEVASLLMALEYRNVKVTESELIRQLPFSDPGPRSASNIWGDPNLGFVGNIDGQMPNTGYGVYEQPIYDLAVKYRPAKIATSSSLDELVTELANGNPIVVWGVVGTGRDISWKTAAGKTISAKLDEHARTLIGYTGTSKNPQQLILLDPIYGELRMNVKDFLANWGKLDNRAVVIYD
jgi:uncharacterized protein YvpB